MHERKMIVRIREMIRKLKELIAKLVLKIKRKFAGERYVVVQKDKYNLYSKCGYSIDKIIYNGQYMDFDQIKEECDANSELYEKFKDPSDKLISRKIKCRYFLNDTWLLEKKVFELSNKSMDSDDQEKRKQVNAEIHAFNYIIAVFRQTIEMANSILATCKADKKEPTTEAFITMCDELLILPE